MQLLKYLLPWNRNNVWLRILVHKFRIESICKISCKQHLGHFNPSWNFHLKGWLDSCSQLILAVICRLMSCIDMSEIYQVHIRKMEPNFDFEWVVVKSLYDFCYSLVSFSHSFLGFFCKASLIYISFCFDTISIQIKYFSQAASWCGGCMLGYLCRRDIRRESLPCKDPSILEISAEPWLVHVIYICTSFNTYTSKRI